MPFAANKKSNEYADAIPATLFEKMPKDVFAAVALSLALRLNNDDLQTAVGELVSEWQTLYQNGVIPQKPPNAIAENRKAL